MSTISCAPYVKEARQRRIPVKTFTIPMHDVDRAITDGEEYGFVKIHVREGGDKILGATIGAGLSDPGGGNSAGRRCLRAHAPDTA